MRWWFGLSMATAGLLALSPSQGEAQQLRSFTSGGSRSQQAEIPREYRPPKGMCRIWIDGVPPNQQPAPTDCPTAVRNKPKNARVIYGDDAKDADAERRDKDKPKKPEGSAR